MFSSLKKMAYHFDNKYWNNIMKYDKITQKEKENKLEISTKPLKLAITTYVGIGVSICYNAHKDGLKQLEEKNIS